MREDSLDAYRYIRTKLNQDLEEAGSTIQVDGDRVVAIGFSAGGAMGTVPRAS